MGLLSRRRQSGRTAPPAPPAGPAAPVTVAEPPRPVIRAEDLAGPGWATLAPTPSVFRSIELTAARDFEPALAGRRPLHQALAPLGHAIDDEGPTGVVEVVSVLGLDVAAPTGSATDQAELVLFQPPPVEEAPQAAAGRRRSRTAPTWSSPSRADAPTAAAAPPLVAPPATGTPAQPVPPPVADEGGSLPLVAPPERTSSGASAAPTSAATGGPGPSPAGAPDPAPLIIRTLPTVATPAVAAGDPESTPAPALPLVSAAPPRLPTVELRAARLPEGQRTATVDPARPAAPPAALVGDRPLPVDPATPTAGAPAPSVEAGDPAPGPSAPPTGPDLPLVAPVDPATGIPQSSVPPRPPAQPDGPTVANRPPASPTTSPERAAEAPGELPLASPPAPTSPTPVTEGQVAEGQVAEQAPLIGETPALVEPPIGTSADEQVNEPAAADDDLPFASIPPAAPAPPAPRRPGLGAPIGGLPPTARSLDPLTLRQPHRPGEAAPMRPPMPLLPSVAPRQPRPVSGPTPAPADPGQLPLAPAAPGAVTGSERGGAPATTPLPLASLPMVRLEPLVPEGPRPAPRAMAPLTPLRPFIPSPSAPESPAPVTGEGAAVRLAVGQQQGVDLTQVPVDRSVAGTAEAARLQARAYTNDRGIVIPPEVGTLDAGPGRALLAHELTHVAQRSRLGPATPPEDTPAGRMLEVEAQTAELSYAPPAPGRTVAAPPPPPSSTAGPLAAGAAAPATAPSPSTTPLPLATPEGRPAGITDEAALMAAMAKLSEMGTSAPPAGHPTTLTMTAPSAPAPAMASSAGVQRAVQIDEQHVTAPSSPPAGASGAAGGSAMFANRPSDADLSRLARWLYPLISFKMRGELREDRERSGLLTDTYRRW